MGEAGADPVEVAARNGGKGAQARFRGEAGLLFWIGQSDPFSPQAPTGPSSANFGIIVSMIELTAANAVEYLRGRGFLGPGPAHAEPLGGGVSNAVLRVVTPERRFVLKQSRPQLRTRDAWFSDLGRVWREQEVMQALGPLLPPLTVPEVLFTDRENYVFVMSHAPDDARVWKEALLAGETDAALARRVGAVLGTMHAATHRDRRLVEPFRDHEVFIQLRVDPFY